MSRHEIYCALTRATTTSQLRYINIKETTFQVQGPCVEMKLLRENILLNKIVSLPL